MEWLSEVGTLIAVFFLISLAVETILENFRGFLALFGIEVLKSKKSLQQALDEVAEFLPSEQKDLARFEALVSIVEKSSAKVQEVKTHIAVIRKDLGAAADPSGKLKIVDREKEWLALASAPLRQIMEKSESNRIFALRFVSALIGVGVAWTAEIDVFGLGEGELEAGSPFFGYLIAGLAAAGGSSFWHDQLDRVRNLKQAGDNVASLVATVKR